VERRGPIRRSRKRHVRKDGSFHWVRITTALVREGDGKPEYSVEFLRDISAARNRRKSSNGAQATHDRFAPGRHGRSRDQLLHNVGNILNSVNISASS